MFNDNINKELADFSLVIILAAIAREKNSAITPGEISPFAQHHQRHRFFGGFARDCRAAARGFSGAQSGK